MREVPGSNPGRALCSLKLIDCCRVQRGGGGRCRVQQGDSPRNEAVPEPASPGTVGVGAVLGDAARPPQTSSVLDSLDGGE